MFAQRDLATIVVTVTDPSGGRIANAQVTVTEPTTNQVYNGATNNSGEFVRPALRPSTYDVAVTAPGFQKSEQKGVLLEAGSRAGVSIALTVGAQTQTVEVTASAPLLQTESTQLGADITSKQLTDEPLGGNRIFSFLARLSPGVVPGESGSRDVAGGGFSANGVRSNGQNNFLLNGVDNNVNTIDFMNQTSYSVGPSVEAIGEMTIETNGYNAEYGRAAGGVINVVLKSGTNQLHGSLYEIMQNRDFDANTWNNDRAGAVKGPFIQNLFGATLGGPIIKNKLFIFGDYEGIRLATAGGIGGIGASSYQTVATAAERTGNFSQLLGASLTGTDANGNPINIQKGQIYDPTTTTGGGVNPVSRLPFAGNIIPPSRIDPVYSKLINGLPAPNQAGAAALTGTDPTNDYYYLTHGGIQTDQGDSRVDYRLSDKDSLFGSVSWSNTEKNQAPPYAGALDNGGWANETDINRNAQLSYTRVWSPTLVTETRLAFTRLETAHWNATAYTDELKAYGIGGYDYTNSCNGCGGLPNISTGGYTTFGGPDWTPTIEYNNVWDFVQNVNISKGSHAIKTGFEFRSIAFPFFQTPDPHGNISYNAAETAFPSNGKASNGSTVGSDTGDGLASAMLGVVDNAAISTNNFISSQKVAYAGYVQDDWKFSSKITFNLGVRYELWSPIGEKWGDQANYDLQNNTLYIPQGRNSNLPLPPNFASTYPTTIVSRGQVNNYLIPWDKLDIGPRIGVAYNFMPKMVLRLGYGIFYGGEENQGGSPNRGEGVPFNETVSLVRAQGISSYTGISDPLCVGCDYFPSGLGGGFPGNPFALNAPIQFRGVQPDFRNPLVHKWNAIVQRELPWNMSLEVGYEGNHQAHQVYLTNTDYAPNLGTLNSSISAATLQEIQPQCPPPTCVSPGNGLSMTLSNGFGNYAAGTVKLEKRYSNGLQFITSYTWSHALADSGTPLSGGANFGVPYAPNQGSAYASAAWDIRHSFTTGFNYDLPFGRGKQFGGNMPKIADIIVGQWHTNGILTLRTGQPFSFNGTSCQGVWNKCSPDIVPGNTANEAPSGGRTANEWFNINAYEVAAPLTGGDLGQAAGTGPPTTTLDFSTFKDFALTERFKMQFRGEFFNFFNTPIYGQPDASLGDLKSLGGNGNFGVITTASGERHIQFSLRLSF
jgi:hypothetical protein